MHIKYNLQKKEVLLAGIWKKSILLTSDYPSARSAIQTSSLKNAHVYFIKSFTLPNFILIRLLEANSFSSLTVGFCCFAENSISMNSATLYLSVSFSEDTGLCNEEVIWMLKESTIREVYEFFKFLINKSLLTSQMQTLIIDLSETKFCQFLLGIDFIKNQLGFAKLALSIIASKICFLEAFYFRLSIASIVRDLRRLVAIS